MSETAPKRPMRIVFAGGGTAGHVEPALAVARKWLEIYPDAECRFIGTSSGLEKKLVPQAGFPLSIIEKVVLPRRLNFNLLALPFRLMKTVSATRKIVRGSDLLVGFGGYVSAPAYLASRLEGVPFLIHEANAKAGWANRLGALLTSHLAIAHEVARGKFSRALVTGLPLRREVQEGAMKAASDWHGARSEAKKSLGWVTNRPTLLVLGGSQGSTYINEQVARALPLLVAQGFQILHSVGGKNELPSNSKNYTAVSYIEDIATAYLAADIVLSRSGAVTCAEFGALGRFAIFVPLPTGNGEQARNADHLVSAGRALVVPQQDFSSDWIVRNVGSAIELSARANETGLTFDLNAAENMVKVMQTIIESAHK